MKKFYTLAFLTALVLAAAPGAEARKLNGGNPLGAPDLVAASILAAGEAECDGDTLTTDDVCVEVTFTKVCAATKYSVDVDNGVDTDADGCDDTTLDGGGTLAAEACTGVNNCLDSSAECQTGVVSIGETTICVDDGDGITDCVNDLEDVLAEKDSTCVKVKGLNPAQKGPKAVSQSTPYSDTICPDINDECI